MLARVLWHLLGDVIKINVITAAAGGGQTTGADLLSNGSCRVMHEVITMPSDCQGFADSFSLLEAAGWSLYPFGVEQNWREWVQQWLVMLQDAVYFMQSHGPPVQWCTHRPVFDHGINWISTDRLGLLKRNSHGHFASFLCIGEKGKGLEGRNKIHVQIYIVATSPNNVMLM